LKFNLLGLLVFFDDDDDDDAAVDVDGYDDYEYDVDSC
jgi:hypothetical protein